jgi:hypothetical protein
VLDEVKMAFVLDTNEILILHDLAIFLESNCSMN